MFNGENVNCSFLFTVNVLEKVSQKGHTTALPQVSSAQNIISVYLFDGDNVLIHIY